MSEGRSAKLKKPPSLIQGAIARARRSSWQTYGLGGDIDDAHDAILAAANLLHQAGAPGDYRRALYSYNPSNLYVDAVRRYATLIGRDPDALYLLYSWPSP